LREHLNKDRLALHRTVQPVRQSCPASLQLSQHHTNLSSPLIPCPPPLLCPSRSLSRSDRTFCLVSPAGNYAPSVRSASVTELGLAFPPSRPGSQQIDCCCRRRPESPQSLDFYFRSRGLSVVRQQLSCRYGVPSPSRLQTALIHQTKSTAKPRYSLLSSILCETLV
jgi:hypothetical protein